jgi:hypothetical protein
MSNSKAQQNKTPKVLILTHEAARKICEKHGHMKVAQEVVEALPYRANLNSTEVAELVQVQILHFEQSLVKCVERANEVAGKVGKLPGRAEQGAALREIREALENLRDVVERNWDLAGPLLEIETTEQLGRLLTTEAAKELLPANLRSEYIDASGNVDEYNQRRLKLGYILDAGSRPLTRLIKGAKITVRRAEQRIPSGAPLKVPLEMALIMGLADHFRWALERKAAWTDDGPFSRFCADVFESLEFDTEYSWEHLLREGLKLHRSSFGARHRHKQDDEPHGDGGQSHKRKPRKQKLAPLRRRKTSPNQ